VRKVRWFGLALAAFTAAAGLALGGSNRWVMVAVGAWAGALVLLVTRVPRARGVRRGDEVELRSGFATRWILPTVFLAPLLALPLALARVPERTPRWGWVLVAAAGALWAFSVGAAHVRFLLGAGGIERLAPWPIPRRQIPWEGVVGIREKEFRLVWLLVVIGRDRRSFRIPEEMNGIGDFAALALRHVAPGALDAQPGLRARLETLAAPAGPAIRRVGQRAPRDPWRGHPDGS
jgi:hypothetical protein